MNSFYSTLYAKFVGLQIEQSHSAKLVYPVSNPLPFLKIGKEISGCVVGIPSVRIEKSTISFGQYIFKNNEFGQSSAVKLALASTCLLSAKLIFYWLYRKNVKEWIATKTETLKASYVMNILLDTMARQRISDIEGENFCNDVMIASDTLSAVLLHNNPKDFSELVQYTLTSYLLNVPAYAPKPILRVVQSFLSKLNSFTFDTSELINFINHQLSSDDDSHDNDNNNNVTGKFDTNELRWNRIDEIANALYDAICKVPGKWCTTYLPYSNALNSDGTITSLFGSKIIAEQEFSEIRLRISKLDSSMGDDITLPIFFELSREEKRNKKMLARLSQATHNLNFDTIGFPICDYSTYHELYVELAPEIRRIVERVRLVKNVLDENMLQESGSIDLQVAIQAVASETPRNDIFTRDENLLKNESWTILVDSSLSLMAASKQVKAISICLAESAREILGSSPWGMFAFSDKLYCIKDFTEPYNNQIRARIGGLTLGGLSYIPDAIRTCRNLISEYAEDNNYLILVSDGNPSGYVGIEEEFAASIRELGKSGIDLAAIGVAGSGIKKIIHNAKVIEEPIDIVRQFMEIYYRISS